jgi:hypothetical protein
MIILGLLRAKRVWLDRRRSRAQDRMKKSLASNIRTTFSNIQVYLSTGAVGD